MWQRADSLMSLKAIREQRLQTALGKTFECLSHNIEGHGLKHLEIFWKPDHPRRGLIFSELLGDIKFISESRYTW